MRLDGRRRSANVEDRRHLSGGKKAGIGGLLGIAVVVVMTLLGGGDLGDVLTTLSEQGGLQQSAAATDYVETPEDARLADLTSKVLAGTEDVWTREFRKQGWGEYRCPKLVLFHGGVQSGCGVASSQTGPFYCSADETVYIDLEFFKEMQQNIGGSGDFAYAYVIAHEVGHHVQQLLGTLGKAHSAMARLSQREANQISVRLELQADYYAGVWAYQDNRLFHSIEEGDIERAVDVAGKIGDDYLQRKAYGREMPDSFNHGRSEQRVRWFSRGIEWGDPQLGDTFSPQYDAL